MLVAMMFPKGSVLVNRFDSLLMKASQGGFMNKLVNDVAWDQQRSGTGKLLQVKSLLLLSSHFLIHITVTLKSIFLLGFCIYILSLYALNKCVDIP